MTSAVVYRPLAAQLIVRPTQQCLRGPKPKRIAGWDEYLDWCAKYCDCQRCVRLQIEAS